MSRGLGDVYKRQDDLFGVSTLEHAKDVVMKYSVLRDEQSFREAMECLNSQMQTIDSAIAKKIGNLVEMEEEKIQLEALKMHLFLQQSWESAQNALEIADELVRKTNRMPYKLQRLQLRFMLGKSRHDLQKCEQDFRDHSDIETLQIYFELLIMVEQYEKILELQASDNSVKMLMMPPASENVVLWEQCVLAAAKTENCEFVDKNVNLILQEGTPEEKFDILWEIARLYKRKNFPVKCEEAKRQLRSLLNELTFSAYSYEKTRKAIENL